MSPPISGAFGCNSHSERSTSVLRTIGGVLLALSGIVLTSREKFDTLASALTPGSDGAVEMSALQGGVNLTHSSDPAFDTADFADTTPGNLRTDYVLPRRGLPIGGAGVFWPTTDDPLFRLVGVFPFPSSDHRLVWLDVSVPAASEP